MRLPRLPNRWRITLWVLASIAVVASIAGAVAVRVVEDRFTADIDRRLADESTALAAAIDVLEPDQLRTIADQPGFGDSSHVVAVLSGDEVITITADPTDDPDPLPDLGPAARARLRAQAGSPVDLPSEDGKVTYRALVTQLPDGRLTLVATSLAARDDAIRTVIGSLVASALGATLVISVTVFLVSGHITRPLDAMIDTAEAIGAGDLRARVPTDGVDDVARLAGALNAMLDRLEEAFADREASEEALRRFVADASHELRTPLAAVLGYAELYHAEMAREPAQVGHVMDRIAAEGERMRALVEELLLLARLDEGRPLDREPVDLAGLAEVAVADARTVEPGRPLTVERADGPDGAGSSTVSGDALSLRQAIDNLLANARAHTPTGTPVAVRVEPGADVVRVTVADEGPGMAPADAARAFDRFFRAEPSRARPGTGPGGSGLGLAIVAAVVEAHGGRATVDTAPGRGAAFALELPVDPPPPPTSAPER